MNPSNYYNPNANYFSSNPSATAGSEKAKFVASAASSPGSYKGTPIQGGTDPFVASQIKNIDAGGTPGTNTPGSTTPSASGTPAIPDQQSTTDEAYKSYLATLSQPTDVTEATKYVNGLITQGKQDQETALNRGETLGFATGEAARVGRNNAITLESATQALNALTAANASKSVIAKARLDYEQAKLDSTTKNNPAFELSPGQSRYQYNPKTGAYEKIASVAPTPKEVSAADKKAVLQTDVNQAVDQLGKIVKAKGFRGVSVDDYNTMRQYLQDTYGVDGVIELDKALKALGLTVDVDFAKEDAKLKK